VPALAKKGASNSGGEVAAIRRDEAERQRRIREGTKRISDMFGAQFNDNFFNSRRDSFTNYAMPQLADQHRDAAKQLTFSLDRRGALDSSSRAKLEADLERKRALLETEIRDKGLDYANSARANVEGARSDLINTLNATGDVEGAVQSAQARAMVLSQSPGYSPLVSMFSDFTNSLGQQAAAERAFAYGAGPRPAFSTGLFGTPAGAVRNS
jgi:hypothetical protein